MFSPHTKEDDLPSLNLSGNETPVKSKKPSTAVKFAATTQFATPTLISTASTTPAVSDWVVPATIKSPDGTHYQIGRALGKGGFATCYLFRDLKSGKEYAGKVIQKASLTKPATKRKLKSEIEIHSSVRHRFIVPFLSSFETSDAVYMILGMCENQTLMEMMRTRKRLSVPEVQYFGLQLVQGLKYLHKECKVLHRDLKLGNLMLSKEMDLKIGDFGLAAFLENEEDRRKTVCGTPNYIAPEVLDGSKTAGHSYEVDIWGFGVVLYTLLAGTPPFETKHVKETYKKIKESEVEFPEDHLLPPAFKDLILNILQKDPEKRLSLDQIAQHEFFRNPPVALPTSALHTLPQNLVPVSSTYMADLESRMTNMRMAPPPPAASNEDAMVAILRYLTRQLAGTKDLFPPNMPSPPLPPNRHLLSPSASLFTHVVKFFESPDFGMGVLLSNGVLSVRFNDLTYISWPLNSEFFLTTSSTGMDSNHRVSNFPDEFAKKVRILHQFKEHLLGDFKDLQQIPAPSAELMNNSRMTLRMLDGTQKWIKTKHCTVFKLFNGTIQAKFTDGTELSFHMNALPRFVWISKSNEKEALTFDKVVEHRRQQVYSRVYYVKNILATSVRPQ